MAFHWDNIPALRVLLPFMAGIILANLLNFHQFQYQIGVLTLLFILALVVLHIWKRPLEQRRYEWFFGLFASIALVGLGYANTAMQNDFYNNPHHFANYLTDSSFAIVRLTEPIVEKERTYKAIVEVQYIVDRGKSPQSVSGKAIAYIQKDTLNAARQLQYGDVLLTNAVFRRVQGALNPAGFDYAAYLSMSGIYHQAYINAISWEKLADKHKSYAFWRWIYGLRTYCAETIETYIDSGYPHQDNTTEQAVALALLIGNTDLVDDEILKTYSHTGAMHILAVSGMHVAIFWFLLNWLLGFLDKRGTKGRFLKASICLVAIWTFALVSGFSPSVARAAVMFTIVLVGQQLNFRANAYNTMAVAALILLTLQPMTLFHVGLQLSFLAVLGIVYFQVKIKYLLAFTVTWGYKVSLFMQIFLPLKISRNKRYNWLLNLPTFLGKYIGEIAAATIAAQITTLPLTLYYFHQFPVYFLLANLLAVPLSGFALYSGFVLMAFGKCAWLAAFVGKITYWLIHFTNVVLLFVGKLPGAIIDGFSINWHGMLLLYGLIGLLAAFFIHKEGRFLKWAAIVTIVGLLGLLFRQYHIAQQHEMVFYHIANGTAIDLVAGTKTISIADSTGASDKVTAFYKQPYRWQLGIKKIVELPIQTLQWATDTTQKLPNSYQDKDVSIRGALVNFDGQKILIYDKKQAQYEPTDTISVDYLYLCGNEYADLFCLAEKIHFKRVIMDASNSQWRINRWEEQLAELNIPYYSIKNNQALTLPW